MLFAQVVGPPGRQATRMDKFTSTILKETGLAMIGKPNAQMQFWPLKRIVPHINKVGGAVYLVSKAIKNLRLLPLKS